VAARIKIAMELGCFARSVGESTSGVSISSKDGFGRPPAPVRKFAKIAWIGNYVPGKSLLLRRSEVALVRLMTGVATFAKYAAEGRRSKPSACLSKPLPLLVRR